MEKYLSTKQVMQMLPLSRATCVKMMHELGAVTLGKKLMIRESLITSHLTRLEAARSIPITAKKPRRKPTAECMLTPDGKIPTRKQMREMKGAMQ